MRPNATTLPVLLLSLLAGGAVAEEPAPGADDAAAAVQVTQALPAAVVPPAQLVPLEKAQAQAPQESAVEAAMADAPEAPQVAHEVEAESAELEDLRKAEEAARVRETPERPLPGSTDALGLESPIRDRIDGALGREGSHVQGEEGGRIALLPELDHDLLSLQAEYDIPIDVNEAVVAYIRFFQGPLARAHFVKWLGRSHRYLERYREIMRREGIPEDTVYLAMIESGFANFAYSRAKASGPWQFIGPTGRRFGLQQDFWVDERRDPERSAHAAARYLKVMYQELGDWRLTWAAYNAGEGRIYLARKKGYNDFWDMAATKGKKVLWPETKGYVPKLMAAAIIAKHPESFGFKPEEIEKEAWTNYVEVDVPGATLLSVLARAAGVEERVLVDLNPELRRACTPPRAYKLKIPAGSEQAFNDSWPAMKGQVRMTFAGHIVRRGDTLSRVAALYGVPVQGIQEMNGIPPGRRLRVGQELLIPKPIGSGVAVARAEPVRRAEVAPAPPRTRPTLASVRRPEPAAVARPKHVQVRSGDTLWSISQRYGVELDELCRLNGIKDPHRHKLLAGTRLKVERG